MSLFAARARVGIVHFPLDIGVVSVCVREGVVWRGVLKFHYENFEK